MHLNVFFKCLTLICTKLVKVSERISISFDPWQKYYLCTKNAKQSLMHYQILNFSNIAITILSFYYLLQIKLLIFQLCNSKIVRSKPVCFIFVLILYIGSWLLPCIIHVIIALPTTSNIFCFFKLLKQIAKSRWELIPIAFGSV